MADYKRTQALIGSVPILIEIDSKFGSILRLLSMFGESKKFRTNLRITVHSAQKNLVQLSKNHNYLRIAGPDIDDLCNPFIMIGLLQGILRFAGLHSIKRGSLLLHGSAARMKNRSLCFADDGESVAKTLSSIEVALMSKRYIGDEFCFLDIESKKISGFSFIPIHFRKCVQEHLEIKHKLQLPQTDYKKSSAGYFINPNFLFDVVENQVLDAFVYVYYTRGDSALQRLNDKQSFDAIASTITAHIIKLLNPKYDRMRFIGGSDTVKTIKYSSRLTLMTLRELGAEKIVKRLAEEIPCYKITAHTPCDVAKICEKL